MSAMDRVDYDLMKYERTQVVLDARFNEFRDQVGDIIATAREHLSALSSQYEELISFDDLVVEINEQIDDNLKF